MQGLIQFLSMMTMTPFPIKLQNAHAENNLAVQQGGPEPSLRLHQVTKQVNICYISRLSNFVCKGKVNDIIMKHQSHFDKVVSKNVVTPLADHKSDSTKY